MPFLSRNVNINVFWPIILDYAPGEIFCWHFYAWRRGHILISKICFFNRVHANNWSEISHNSLLFLDTFFFFKFGAVFCIFFCILFLISLLGWKLFVKLQVCKLLMQCSRLCPLWLVNRLSDTSRFLWTTSRPDICTDTFRYIRYVQLHWDISDTFSCIRYIQTLIMWTPWY